MCNGGAAAGKDRISEDDVVVVRMVMMIANIGLENVGTKIQHDLDDF